MKMVYITPCLCTLLFLSALAQAQKTEVDVLHGRVRAVTPIANADIQAGQKATISSDGRPVVMVSEPLVEDVMKLYKWVEEEKQAQRHRIDTSVIMVQRVDDDLTSVLALLGEWKNRKSEASNIFTLPNSIQADAKVYDLEGNPLPVEFIKTGRNYGRYTITHTKTVAPGENFRFISVFRMPRRVDIDGRRMRHQRMATMMPYTLIFYRVILPPSAIFVESSRPVIAVETVEGRIAVTSRAYTGPMGEGKFHLAYLWPDKDKVSLTDIPGLFRGIGDTQREATEQEYSRRTAAIAAGQAVHDQSTPLAALLSLLDAVGRKDAQQTIDLIANPMIKALATEHIEDVFEPLGQGMGMYAFLSAPPEPTHPQEGDKHPIHLCKQGTLLHEATVEMVFQNGKWTFWGFEFAWTLLEEKEDPAAGPLDLDKANSPQPAGGVVHPKTRVQLDWTPARTAQTHGVYFGTDKDNLPLLAKDSVAQDLQPQSLEAGVRYYWRVDEALEDGTKVKGDLWSFAAGKQVARWTFDGHAQDQTPQALHGTFHGNPKWVPGVSGQAVALENEEDYIVIPPMNLDTDTLTITLWVRTEEMIYNPGLVISRDSSSGAAGFLLSTNNRLCYNWNDDPGTWQWNSHLFVPNQTWTFAALVVDSEQATFYMHDGSALKSATNTHRHGEAKFDSVTHIGHDPDWVTVKGAMDDVRIYNYALDKTEIEAIYLKTDESP